MRLSLFQARSDQSDRPQNHCSTPPRLRPAASFLALAIATSLFSTPPTLAQQAIQDTPRGLNPEDASKYLPIETDGQKVWKCLDSDVVIPFDAINDDYCDCPDGSDEPGTSACPNATFYCQNKGHLPATILSSRVNDGLCDPECCDGSDESDGKVRCPDTCEKVGKEFRKRAAEAENLRRAGAKIRAKYISDGKKERSTLESEIAKLEIEVEVASEKEQRLKRALELAESADAEMIERKKASPLYKTLNTHQEALRALQSKNGALKEELRTLTMLLDDLAKGYNPNYQDMAVKGAVVAYKEWRGGYETKQDKEGGEAEENSVDTQGVEGENKMLNKLLDDGDWASAKIYELVGKNVLELMDDGFGGQGGSTSDSDAGILFRIHEYLPDAVVPYFEAMVDTLLDLLIKANVITDVKRMTPRSEDEAEPENVTLARKAYNDASSNLRSIQASLEGKRNVLQNMSSRFGREAEFKALDGQCIQNNMGEYTYEYCFFGRTRQIPNKGGAPVSLGNFDTWDPSGNFNDTQDGYYLSQLYSNGQKCWNGPHRSSLVELVCDTKNALLDVFEAEKCIYSMKVSTPAVCFPSEAAANGVSPGGAGKRGKGEGKEKDEGHGKPKDEL
ncbi:hypothetical protein IE53DRAFT_361022 [Violaceomyces palustris]|uniref:Uncharacterized protein n=1 Tax=Violaceomyces palustris TaxID=1673888 RepID=A0ACD0P274_9BASI|nr:hypothetical protein IE53DRAFT_361022 [Violaceomyces palustris]